MLLGNTFGTEDTQAAAPEHQQCFGVYIPLRGKRFFSFFYFRSCFVAVGCGFVYLFHHRAFEQYLPYLLHGYHLERENEQEERCKHHFHTLQFTASGWFANV